MITGPDASTVFIDAARVQRSGAMPAHIETLFAGRSLPLLDGDEHRERKRFVMAGFTREAILRSYMRGKGERQDMVAFGLLRDEL